LTGKKILWNFLGRNLVTVCHRSHKRKKEEGKERARQQQTGIKEERVGTLMRAPKGKSLLKNS